MATPAWLRPLPVVLLLGAVTILIYLNSLPNGFVFDDLRLIVKPKSLRDISNIPRMFTYKGPGGYRPLRTASHAVEYLVFGLTPTGFRAVNITLHILNSALVFFLFRTLLRDPRPALLAAMLFAVHPIQTESVAYISGRRDVLFTLFYLLGFASYVRYRETDRFRYLFLTGFSYLLSLLSKEMAITLPILCFCYEVIRSMPVTAGDNFPTPWQAVAEGARRAIRQHKAFYSFGAAGQLFLVWYYVFPGNPSYQGEMYGGGIGPTLLTSARIFVHYLKLILFPLTLNADYSYNAFPVSRSLGDPRALFALGILGAVTWGLLRLLPSARWAAFGGVWFFVTLLPVSQIVPHHEMMAEHYLYLPSAGVFLTAGVLVEMLLAKKRQQVAIMAAFALVVMVLGVRTIVRNRDWRDSQTLWTRTTQTAPGSARAHTNVGEIAFRQGRFTEAYREFEEAIRIKPNDPIHQYNFGLLLLRHGLFDEAERHFKEALRIEPLHPGTHVSLGLLYLNRRQLDEAEREFRASLASNKITEVFRAEILNNLGIVLARKGRRQEAERAFVDAVRVAPGYAEARANLGKVYLEKGMSQEGVAQLAEAARLNNSDARFQLLLGQAYYTRGEREYAAIALARALSLKADLTEARILLEKIYRERAHERGRRG